MEDRDPRDEIADLEERLARLAESLERSRKIMLAARLSMTIGGIWMLAALVGLLGFDPAVTIVAAAAIIGGIVLFGSTTTTVKQTSAAMKEAEALRTELIGKIELRTVKSPHREP
jgi:hypothetical protein